MTREEAIKIVKEFINGTCLHLVDQEALETLIPELRENKDERMIKAINNMLPFIPDGAYANNGVTKEQVLAWLVKQKEHKRTPKFKVGDNVKYKGDIYKITDVKVRDNGPFYSVSIVSIPSDPEEVVTGIGPGGEDGMVKIELKSLYQELTSSYLNKGRIERLKTISKYIKSSGYEDDAEFLEGLAEYEKLKKEFDS